jgi:exopolysaccharide biosynthesis polyprenyl glycosylphosphotransferase
MVPRGTETHETQRTAGPRGTTSPIRRSGDRGRVMTHPPEKAGPPPRPHIESVPSEAGPARAGPDLTNLGARRVILVGARRATRRLARKLGEQPWRGPRIVGFVDAGHGRDSQLRPRSRHLALHPQTQPIPVLGAIEQLNELVDRAGATDVVVAVSQTPDAVDGPLASQLINSKVSVHWISVESGALGARVLNLGAISHLAGDLVDQPRQLRRRALILASDKISLARMAKRFCDVSLAAAALVVLTPLLVIAALAVLVGSGRPILYTQERVGRAGRRFRIYKFRSMRCDAERETGPIWASDHDSRCTRVGDWLRHSNIDELPQLFNVLRGEMSLIGPRPERPEFVEQFRQTIPDYDLRHAVQGGMTGWAQVHGWRGRTSLRKRIQYDLDYIEHWSFWLDVKILFMTIQHVFWGKTSWKQPNRTKTIAQ